MFYGAFVSPPLVPTPCPCSTPKPLGDRIFLSFRWDKRVACEHILSPSPSPSPFLFPRLLPPTLLPSFYSPSFLSPPLRFFIYKNCFNKPIVFENDVQWLPPFSRVFPVSATTYDNGMRWGRLFTYPRQPRDPHYSRGASCTTMCDTPLTWLAAPNPLRLPNFSRQKNSR